MKREVTITVQIDDLKSTAYIPLNSIDKLRDRYYIDGIKEVVQRLTNELTKTTIESNEYEFGGNKYYFPGQVVVWRGGEPAILKIKGKTMGDFLDKNCFTSTTDSHTTLHYDNLRPATKREIEILGNRDIILI